MATLLHRSSRALPYIAGAAALGAAAGTLYARPRIHLDSAQNAPKPALSFPSSMLFPKQFTVKEVEQVNHDTKRITFTLPGGDSEVSGVPFGSAILTSHWPTTGYLPVFRPYTPISSPSDPGTLQLLVKQYPHGRASSHLHSLTPGSTLTVRGPIPAYTYTPSPSQPRDLVLIAGGAGITPIYSLARGILSDERDQTRIQLLWGVNGTRDIVLRSQLEELEARHPDRLSVTYCVSGPEGKPEAAALGEPGKWKKGYINAEVLKQAVDRAKQGSWGDGKGTKVFICGPPAMQEAIAGKKGLLLGGEFGLVKKEVHTF